MQMQQKYAEFLKNEFLKELESSQVDKAIVEYFKQKPAEFYLRKKHKLRRILGHLRKNVRRNSRVQQRFFFPT